MVEAEKEPRLLIPQLKPFYDSDEYPLMWGLVMFAVALRGGGPWSLDRKIGVQL